MVQPESTRAQRKMPSAYSRTWTNGSQWRQTNDPNSNPNWHTAGQMDSDCGGARQRTAEVIAVATHAAALQFLQVLRRYFINVWFV